MTDGQPHVEDVVTPIDAAQYRGRPDPTVVTFDYDGINWDVVDDSDVVGETHTIAWGGYPGAYETVAADGFEAVTAYLDSALTDANVLFVTPDGPAVYEFVAEDVRTETLESEALRVLRHLSREGIVDGLQPVRKVGPPTERLGTELEFHPDVEAFELDSDGTDVHCRIVPTGELDPDALLEDVRQVDGVAYPQPDSIELVDELG